MVHTTEKLFKVKIVFYSSSMKKYQAMKFGQVIEYNMRNIFLQNHTQNVVEKLFPNPFLKN